MVPPSRHRRASALAVPGLALLALALVAAGVQLGDRAVPTGDARSPLPAAAELSRRPAAQISAQSPRTGGAGAVAAALGAIGELASSSGPIQRPVDSPAEPGALPAPLRSPQPAPAPGTSPPPSTGAPPDDGPGALDPPPAAGGIVETVQDALAPFAPLADPVIDPAAATIEPVLEVLGPIASGSSGLSS